MCPTRDGRPGKVQISPERVSAWLETKRDEWIRASYILAAIQFLGSAAVVFVFTTYLAAMLAVVPGLILGIPLGWCYVLAALIVVGICWLHWKLYDADQEFTKWGFEGPFAILSVILSVVLFAVPILFRLGLPERPAGRRIPHHGHRHPFSGAQPSDIR